MGAVLPTPNLPTLINMEDLKTYIDSEIEKGIEKALPAAIEKVLSDPENPLFLKAVESILAISEHKILKRLYDHDVLLGLREPVEDEEFASLPAQIKALEQRHLTINEKPTEEKKDESPVIPSTTLDFKAVELTTHLKENVKPMWTGEIVMSTRDIYTFLKEKVTEGLRWKPDLRNPRQAKKDILERAVAMYPNVLEIKKNKSGNKVTGIALKPSVKCRHTDTC